MIVFSRLTSSIVFAVALLLGTGLSQTASAGGQAKSWELDVYDDGTDVTYVDDGYDDVTVYDHRYDRYETGYDFGNGYDDSRYYDDGAGYGRGRYCPDRYDWRNDSRRWRHQRYRHRGW